jgi:hypothetical protein
MQDEVLMDVMRSHLSCAYFRLGSPRRRFAPALSFGDKHGVDTD